MQGLSRKLCLVTADAVLLSVAYALSFWLRVGSIGFSTHVDAIWQTLPVVLGIFLTVHLRMGLFNAILRYASIDTAVTVLKSVTLAVLLSCLVLFLLFRLDGVPRSIFVIYFMAALLVTGATRLSLRFWRTGVRPDVNARQVLLYGAQDTADLVLRGLMTSPGTGYAPVGLLDENPAHRGQRIHGVRVYGGWEALAQVARETHVDELWICNPDLVGEQLRTLYAAASAQGIRVKILPRLEHTLLGADIRRFHDPDISDLLRRPPRRLDRDRMKSWVRGRRVLITGAGGSIGRELARQVGALEPAALALCDASEQNLFEVNREMALRCGPVLQHPFLVNVCDAESVSRMMREVRPDIVFHAAACKHVPLVEINPCEGILTNVSGLAFVARAAIKAGVREFVFISTDKAVRPANVMGATKRLGEKIAQILNREGRTRFMAVRFGNVLGSSGSVVPIFQEQIRRGGPVTLTHAEMTRYFMLVSEAVELVIQAGSIGQGGEIFVLDMGQPVRIADMAGDLIRLMGKEGEVRIEFTGIRPGEKLHEELLIRSDDRRTPFPDIWVDQEHEPETGWGAALDKNLDDLFDAARAGDRARSLQALKRLVPRFTPQYEGTRTLIQTPVREPAATPA